MHLTVLNKENTIVNSYISELRDVDIQGDSMRFKTNINRIGSAIAYEISKHLSYQKREIQTPLGKAQESTIQKQPVVASVLRAGLPLHQGIVHFFDRAENAFVSAFRIERDNGELDFKVEYNASPNLTGKTLILADPMLATGNSMYLAYQALLEHGTPERVHIAAVIGSQQGVDFVRKNFPEDTHLWIGAVDQELNEQSYIVPGLGDAGDLSFGQKQ